MKLWLLTEKSQKGRGGYDITNAMVVRAKSEKDARLFAEDSAQEDGYWMDPKLSNCEQLTQTGDAGVVIKDFNAG